MSVSKWFRPVGIYDLAFLFQRLTGIILVIYLCMHLVYLSTLREPSIYESFLRVTTSPQYLPFDIMLVLCGVYHGINGVRIILHELGFLHEHKKVVLAIAIVTIIVAWVIASYMMLEVI